MNNKTRAKELVSKMTFREKFMQMLFEAPSIEKLNIPKYNWWGEALHGAARSGLSTVFPQAIGMASTFNLSLMRKVGDAISDELRAKYNEYQAIGDATIYKGLTVWSPNINIFRDPRWGRGHETYGEDPYLTAKMGTEFVKGLQGDENYKYKKCDATLKHFAVHSGPELNRLSFESFVNKKDLEETYLYAFKKCIEDAKPSAVMGAYNKLDGIPCCLNKNLLTEILREKWKFDGYVVSDCGAICEAFNAHKYTKTKYEAAALAVKAGCDLNCGNGYSQLQVALEANLITEDDITKCVERLIEARLNLGMLDDDNKYDKISYDVVECEEHIALAREMASESIVLLKNDGVLPIKNSKLKIGVIGENAENLINMLGNYNGFPSHAITIIEGLRSANVCPIKYTKGCGLVKFDEYNTPSDAIALAKNSDIIIYVTGLTPKMEGENGDDFNSEAGGDKLSLSLPKIQYELYGELKQLNKPIIVINMSGSAVALNVFEESASAVMQLFYTGQETGNAVADIVFGKTSPSGKLPITFYKDDKDLPPFDDYSMQNRTYRYFSGETLYPFGYGLSYANFEYELKSIENDEIEFSVKNISDFTAKEVWMLYVTSGLENQPLKRLARFGKVELAPNQSQTIIVKLEKDIFDLYDENGDIFTANKYKLHIKNLEIDYKNNRV